MLVTDFDRSRGTACELCPAPIVQGQPVLTCAGCAAKRVHEYCASYALSSDTTSGWWCCSNCRDGRPKRPHDPNLSLRTGSARARKAPDTYQVIDTRPTGLVAPRRRTTTPPVPGIPGSILVTQHRADTPMSGVSINSLSSEPKGNSSIDAKSQSTETGNAPTLVMGSASLPSQDSAELMAETPEPQPGQLIIKISVTPTPSTPTTDDTATSSGDASSLRRKRLESVERPRSPILTRARKRSKSTDPQSSTPDAHVQ